MNKRYVCLLGRFLLAVSLILSVVGMASAAGKDYTIGVYYFPGWKDDQYGAVFAKPWERIEPFPEREPLLGWYRDGEVAVAEEQLRWMHDYGIDYVVYDWYWDGRRTFLEHSLKAYLQSKNRKLVKFSLLWANHSDVPRSHEEFISMIRYWIDAYFSREEYFRIDGKPVVFIFSQDALRSSASKMGSSTASLLSEARSLASAAGLPGIYFVGGTEALSHWVKKEGPSSGFDAFSAYNYHRAYQGKVDTSIRMTHGYEELIEAYRRNWTWILGNSPLPYFLPMISGWDRRPWGGSKDGLHDNSIGSSENFGRHLVAAKKLMDEEPEKSKKIGVICCWNEFGEGSYIEPTKKYRFEYLEQIKRVFVDQSIP